MKNRWFCCCFCSFVCLFVFVCRCFFGGSLYVCCFIGCFFLAVVAFVVAEYVYFCSHVVLLEYLLCSVSEYIIVIFSNTISNGTITFLFQTRF